MFKKKPQGQSSQTGLSEKLNTNEDASLKSGTTENGYTRYGLSSVNRSGESVMMGSSGSPRKELRTQRSFVQRGAPQLSKFSNSVAARDASHFSVANPRWLEDSYNNNKGDGDWSQRLLVKPKYSTKDKESIRVSRTSGFLTIIVCFALLGKKETLWVNHSICYL